MSEPIEQAFVDIAHAQSIPPAWVLSNLLPVGLTVMSGPPKVSYKSTIALIAGAVSAGWDCRALPPWIRKAQHGPSLIVSYEADAGVCRNTLEQAGVVAEPGAIYIAHDPFGFQLDIPEQANNLLDFINTKDPSITVIDPFRNAHSADENDSATIIQLLAPLVHSAHRRQASILLVHHVVKPSEQRSSGSFYAMRGSSALPGLADGLITIEDTDEAGQIIINAVFKRGPSYRRKIQLGIPGFGWPERGVEILPTKAGEVENLLREGITDVAAIAARLRLAQPLVIELLEGIRRNSNVRR